MAKVFHVTAPDGHTLEVTGPDDATPEQAIAQAQQLYKPQAAKPPDPNIGGDDRTPGQVAIDQAANVGKGAVDAVTSIPDMVREGAGMVSDALQGHAMSVVDRLKNAIAGIGHSYVDPVATSVRGAAALVAPNSVAPPSSKDWSVAAHDAGGQLGNAIVGKAVESVPTSAEGIQNIANKLRAIKENPNAIRIASVGAAAPIGAALGGPLGAAVAAPIGATVGPAVVDAVARPVASLVEKAARLRAALDTAPNVDVPPTPVSAPTATVEPTPAVQQTVRNGTGPAVVDAAPPSNPIAAETPELQALRAHIENPLLPDAATEAPAARPIEMTPELQALHQDIQRQILPAATDAAPSSNPIEPTPAVQQLAQKPETPSITGPATSREIQMAREAILQNGAPRSTANLLKVSRIVPQLLDTVPELKSVLPGANFDTRLYNAFQSIGHELSATEASIPDNTLVPTDQAVKQLGALEQKYVDTNQPGAVRAIDKVKSFLEDKPAMPWSDFIQAKRTFFNEIKLSSAPGREAYQIFKKLSNDVSPELGALNQKYYVVKSAIESAAMDMKTGERIRTIGRPAKPPIQPAAGVRNFVNPL